MNLHLVADLDQACGLTESAYSGYNAALTIKERLLGADHPEVAALCSNLAAALHDHGRCTEASALFRRAETIASQSLPAGHPLLETVRYNQAACSEQAG